MNNKRLLIIAAGELQIPVILRAKEMGIYTIVADSRPSAVGLTYADKAIVTNVTDKENMLQLAKAEHIDGVIHPCSEYAANVMGYLNDQLHLSGISEETAIRATDKHLMHLAFDEAQLPTPKSLPTNSAEHAWTLFNNEFTTDVVLKPSRNSGSRGVVRVTRNISKDNFYSYYNNALTESKDHSVLIEQFIDGAEFSVELIIWQHNATILAVTDKKTTLPPYFVELGHSQPSCYPTETIHKVEQAALNGVEALKLNNCAAHVEVKVQNEQAYIIEIGARLGGDFISTTLTPISTGIDMATAAINVALGIAPSFEVKKQPQGVAIRYFYPQPGQLVAINGTDQLSAPYVYASAIHCAVGDTIPKMYSSADRRGYVITTAPTAQEAITRAENIIKKITFDII